MLTIAVSPHPLLEVGGFVTRFEQRLSEISASLDAGVVEAPFTSSDLVRTEIRQLLRHGGFKPAGRSKPASEYLVAAHAEARFPRINAAVDACNVASLWSGLPISLIDLDRVVGALSIQVCPAGTNYVSTRRVRSSMRAVSWRCSTATARPERPSRTRSARRRTTARARRCRSFGAPTDCRAARSKRRPGIASSSRRFRARHSRMSSRASGARCTSRACDRCGT